jgi:hypothetical protein
VLPALARDLTTMNTHGPSFWFRGLDMSILKNRSGVMSRDGQNSRFFQRKSRLFIVCVCLNLVGFLSVSAKKIWFLGNFKQSFEHVLSEFSSFSNIRIDKYENLNQIKH